MQTIIYEYCFDLNNPNDKAAYKKLRASLNRPCFVSWGRGSHYHGGRGGFVELKEDFFFNNQWNTAENSPTLPNHRVFDWAEDYTENKIRKGHYLDITPAMVAARRDTYYCPYCGKRYATPQAFCDACLGSPYLDKDTLLNGGLRLRAVADSETPWEPLTEAEAADLLPRFIKAQTFSEATEKKRAAVIAKCDKATAAATAERDGFLWLLDHGIKTDNAIYYPHTGRFSFGWQKPIAAPDALKAELEGFPFPYDVV